MTSPLDDDTMSAHFADFGPVEESPSDQFSATMAGPGRWFVMEDEQWHMFGVLWTDDKDALGLFGTEETSPAHALAGWAEIRKAKANGYTATETFDTLLSAYEPSNYGEGALEALYAELSQ